MTLVSAYLVDTNILLRLSQSDDGNQDLAQAALIELGRQGAELFIAPQNIAEFWNVCTRPTDRNGFGLSVAEVERRVVAIETTMTLLPENDRAYGHWRRLVRNNNVRGVQVHDARLAALMLSHGVTYILTFNQPDFRRYEGVTAIHPSEVIKLT